MPISRRSFLIGGASAAALAACSGGDEKSATPATTTTVEVPTTAAAATPLTASPFSLGVASGDPDTTSVVLWTRLVGATGEHPVVWEVGTDERLEHLVAAGVETATGDDAHTVHAIAGDLEAGAEYWYRFTAGRFTSPVGRTHTTPDGDADVLRFAFASCQDWQRGFYTAHEHLAAEDVDLVVHLGDYIYESGINPNAVRQHDSAVVTTLDQYRARYALYKSDPNLQAVHARAPWFVIWDDHEVQDGYAGETPKAVDPAIDFVARRAAAYKAWWEHHPTRLDRPVADALTMYRPLRWGSLVTFFGLDGRQYRDDQPCERASDLGGGCSERDDPARTMLGADQEAWLATEMPASGSRWNVLANQTIFSPSGIPIGADEIFNLDQWDGYPGARARMLDVIAETRNPVIITGDIHASAVGDVRRGDDVVAVELVGPAMSSTFPAQFADLFEAAGDAAGAAMVDAKHNGYVLCEVTPDRFRADYRFVSTTAEPKATVSTASSWQIAAGTPGVRPLP